MLKRAGSTRPPFGVQPPDGARVGSTGAAQHRGEHAPIYQSDQATNAMSARNWRAQRA